MTPKSPHDEKDKTNRNQTDKEETAKLKVVIYLSNMHYSPLCSFNEIYK